jgi:cell division protein FtsL
MNSEELYNIIGKLYTDIYQAQKYIVALQNELKEKDKTLADLRKQIKDFDERQ